MTFAAYGESTQYNAPHGTINVAHYHAGAPAAIRRPWMAPPVAGGLVPRPDVAAPLTELVCGEGTDPGETANSSALPFTGLDLELLAGGGLLLLLGGFGMARMAARREDTV